ncbi:MAG: hypothetical protein ABFD86_05070 [Bryobacteraceae bacterium]
MAKLLFVQVESDSIDVVDFLTMLTRGMSQAMALPAPAKTAVPRMLRAPKGARKSAVPKQPVVAKNVLTETPASPTRPLSEALLEELRRRPMTVSECAEYARGLGYDADSLKCSALLTYHRRANRIYRDDSDGRWHPAVKAERQSCTHV